MSFVQHLRFSNPLPSSTLPALSLFFDEVGQRNVSTCSAANCIYSELYGTAPLCMF
uniref:Uncharacterized protein n=1 Tax=Musa acuminata subsp. malaccensis TaxID=214687 RepID=A0A804U5S0_MUSAM